jgi:cobalt-zinc-cadmium efflux system protein
MEPDRHTDAQRRSMQGLVRALLITATWFFVELIGGLYSNSLALMADAGHMLTDLAALALSLVALKISSLPATHRKTFGYRRAEILAALANGLLLVLIGCYIVYTAYRRFLSPPLVKSETMLLIAVTGLIANLVTAALLYRSQHENLNVRSAFLHVMSDTLGSIGAIIAGIAMLEWKWYAADPVVSVVVAALILIGAWHLITESVDVLLEGTPRHLNIQEILTDLGNTNGVISVHDLHVWSITSGMPAMSCHVVMSRGSDSAAVLEALIRLMRDKYRIEHTTIQLEIEQWVVPPQ